MGTLLILASSIERKPGIYLQGLAQQQDDIAGLWCIMARNETDRRLRVKRYRVMATMFPVVKTIGLVSTC